MKARKQFRAFLLRMILNSSRSSGLATRFNSIPFYSVIIRVAFRCLFNDPTNQAKSALSGLFSACLVYPCWSSIVRYPEVGSNIC